MSANKILSLKLAVTPDLYSCKLSVELYKLIMNPKFNDPTSVRKQSPVTSLSTNQATIVENKSSFQRVAWIKIAANNIIVANSDRVWLLKDKSKLRFS